jgi:hypothetical protein
MTYTTFLSGPGWQQSSGPYINRAVDCSADLWPENTGSECGGGNKDTLANGEHPVLAVGPKATRPRNLTGVVVSYNSANDRAILNIATGMIVKAYVANVTAWTGASPYSFDTSMAIGEPVFVDDSDYLAAGVTLSRSPQNASAAYNPFAGYLWYCEDEYDDSGVGGHTASPSWPKTLANTYSEALYCVLLANDFGN